MALLKLKVSEDGVLYQNLPYVFVTDTPFFSWELPQGTVQHKYCLELKTKDVKKRTDGSFGHGYYNSGIVSSTDNFHKIVFSLDENTWSGAVEVRLRILSMNNIVVASTHSYDSEVEYEFEELPQRYLWDSNVDSNYCARDIDKKDFNNIREFSIQWDNAADVDDSKFTRLMSYEIEICGSPLFGDGDYLVTRLEQSESGSVYTSVNYDFVGRFTACFYRVRGFDGLDYGNWSDVKVFLPFQNMVPICEIIGVNPNLSPRSEGEVLIDFIIYDDDDYYVNAFFEYSTNYYLPESNPEKLERCSLESNTVFVPTNRIVRVVWLSAKNIINKSFNNIYIYLHAFDGLNSSEYDSYGPVEIDNKGLGVGVGGGTFDSLFFYVSGWLHSIEKFSQIPEERVTRIGDNLAVDFKDNNTHKIGDSTVVPTKDYSSSVVGRIMKNTYAAYHGYDFYNDNRLSKELALDYRNESKYRILRSLGYTDEQIHLGLYDWRLNELFVGFSDKYLGESGTYYKKLGLGREDNDVYFHLKRRPDIEPYFSIVRPRISHSYGIYVDGPGFNGNASDYGEYELSPKGDWGNMLLPHPVFDPETAITTLKNATSLVGFDYDMVAHNRYNLWYRFYVKLDIVFHIYITSFEGFGNDRFSFALNDTDIYEGSILDDDVSFMQLEYPYEGFGQNNYNYVSLNDSKLSELRKVLDKMFYESGFFERFDINNFVADHERKRLTGFIYGRKLTSLKTFEVLPTSHSCYNLFGIDTIKQSQIYDFAGGDEWGMMGYDDKKYFSKKMEFVNEDDYEYELEKESSYNYCDNVDDTDGEPLYTCSLVDVNKDGYHFRYTRERFLETGKVYVRIYHTETCHPFEDGKVEEGGMGYRNFVVEPVLGREGIYRRNKTRNYRGIPGEEVLVTLIDGTKEIAYAEPGGEIKSHILVEENGVTYYKRKDVESWQKDFLPKTILIATYVESDVALARNYYESGLVGGSGPINNHMQINPNGHVVTDFNLYIQGAYKPSIEQIEAGLDVLHYNYSSVVSQEQQGEFSRFSKNWKHSLEELCKGECGFVFVDPNLISFDGRIVISRAFGYIPDVTLENYFKTSDEEGFMDKHLHKGSYYVHGILKHPHLNPRLNGNVIKPYNIISDVSVIDTKKHDDFVKRPMFDFRVKGRYDIEKKYYFSGMPRDEHSAYQTRPDIVYREDRPWRVNGFVHKLDEIKVMSFRFLQNFWNSYNLLHWEGSQAEYVYAKIEAAQQEDNGTYINWFDVRTKSSILDDTHGWVVPYNKVFQVSNKFSVAMFNEMTFPKEWVEQQIIPLDWFGSTTSQNDYVDNLNQDNFVFGNTYRFRISSVNIISSDTSVPATSTSFTIDIDAASPPIIVGIHIDKWSKMMTVRFRFDDALGRKYDLSDFHYSIDDGATWINEGFRYLNGGLVDLDSNMYGDRAVSDIGLKTHIVSLDLNLLSQVFEAPERGENVFRIRLTAVLSADKMGMLYPVFNFKMWLNEFLKKAEDDIITIGGQKTRWKLTDERDDDGNIKSYWEYLPKDKAINMPGRISYIDREINELENGFVNWYSGVRKYYYPSVEARNDFLINTKKSDLFKEFSGSKFIEFHGLEGGFESSIIKDENGKNVYSNLFNLNNYFSKNMLMFSFDEFVLKRSVSLTVEFFNENLLWDSFSEWYDKKQAIRIDDMYLSFITQNSLMDEYNDYLIDNEILEDDYFGFVDANYRNEYYEYYNLVNQYNADISTERGVFLNNYETEYNNWLNNTIDLDGGLISFDYLPITFEASDYDDDKWFVFLEYAYKNDIIEKNSFAKSFKDTKYNNARKNYFNQRKGGVPLSVLYNELLNDRANLVQRLNQARCEKIYYETRHRIRMIRQGYFCNGFVDNNPYDGDDVNVAFRFRVEANPIQGNLNRENKGITAPSYAEGIETVPAAKGYEERFEIYYHFQMDFYDTFDSQNGKPLRDIVYQRIDVGQTQSGTHHETNVDSFVRIPGAIIVEDGVNSSPNHVFDGVTQDTGHNVVATVDPYDLQFTGTYSLLKSELPGKFDSDILPSYYDSFEQLYFWRVAPYNLLYRPTMETCFGEVGEITQDGDNYKFSFLNKFNASINNCGIGFMVGWDLVQNKFLYAYEELPVPTWKLDYTISVNDGSWSGHLNRDERWYKNKWLNKSLTNNGIVNFLTDRARKVEIDNEGLISDGSTNYKISYIEDENNNFNSVWIPYNTDRGKPSVIRDSDTCEYYMFYHKPSVIKIVNNESVDSCSLVLARGFNPLTFGEECRIFNTFSYIDVSDVIEGAISFENPFVFKEEGLYRLYFNVVFWNGSNYYTENYYSSSENLYDWELPVLINNLTDCKDITIHKENGVYKLFCIKKSSTIIGGQSYEYDCIFGSVSESYNSFSEPEFIWGYDYQISSPSYNDGKLYYTTWHNNRSRGEIVHVNRQQNNNGVSLDEFDFNIVYIDLKSDTESYYSPCVIDEYDLGYTTKRLFYQTDVCPYLWQNKSLSQFGKLGVNVFYTESMFGTRYLEKYNWRESNIQSISHNGTIILLEHYGGYEYSGAEIPCSPEGEVLDVVISTENNDVPLAVRLPFNPHDDEMSCESIAEWVDYNNIDRTEATLNPERVGTDELEEDYSLTKFLLDNNLIGEYNSWRASTEDTFDNDDDYMVAFLVYSRHIGEYLKWSKRGQGIYRYRLALDKLHWTGDGKQGD